MKLQELDSVCRKWQRSPKVHPTLLLWNLHSGTASSGLVLPPRSWLKAHRVPLRQLPRKKNTQTDGLPVSGAATSASAVPSGLACRARFASGCDGFQHLAGVATPSEEPAGGRSGCSAACRAFLHGACAVLPAPADGAAPSPSSAPLLRFCSTPSAPGYLPCRPCVNASSRAREPAAGASPPMRGGVRGGHVMPPPVCGRSYALLRSRCSTAARLRGKVTELS